MKEHEFQNKITKFYCASKPKNNPRFPYYYISQTGECMNECLRVLVDTIDFEFFKIRT